MSLFDQESQTPDISNAFLFELDKEMETPLSKELRDFLSQAKFPWEILGKVLTAFVEHAVLSVPKEMRLQGQLDARAYLEKEDSIFIGKDAIIEAGAYICGPTFIAPNAVIRHGAYVRGSTYVSEHAVVGHTTECKGAILLPHAKAAHFNYVGDSILGYDCNLGAGTKCANLKISHSNIKILLEGKKLDTGLKKLGAILGNRAQTGCNAVTNPGTIMMPDSILLPNHTSLGIVKK